MPLRELTDDDKTEAIDKTINLIRHFLQTNKRFAHCREELRDFLYAKAEGAFNNTVRDERLDKFVLRLYRDKLDPPYAGFLERKAWFDEFYGLFKRDARDIEDGARPRDPASTPHGHGLRGGPRSPISQHRSSAYGSRPITHSHDSRPMVDQGVKKSGIRVISKFDPRGKRKSEEAHTVDEAHKAARRANWKHATEQARPLSNHQENAISATHRVRQGIHILGPDANKSARKQEEARQRAEKWSNDLQRDARDKRPIDPGALDTLIPCREAEEAKRKAKEAEEAKRKAKEAEIARKAKEAEEAKRKAKEAEEAKRKA
ncbi:MAG: hypothetical protein CL494_07380, partial [Actinobacteria bacterium]|nr:hypothetical protein [Actinomycetota bacterium]